MKGGREIRLSLRDCRDLAGEIDRLLLLLATIEEENAKLRRGATDESVVTDVLFDGGSFTDEGN